MTDPTEHAALAVDADYQVLKMNSYFCSVPSLLIYILHEYPLLPCAVEKQATLEKDQPVAFVSQSTRAFRKRLRDSDVQFAMPADVAMTASMRVVLGSFFIPSYIPDCLYVGGTEVYWFSTSSSSFASTTA